MSSKKIPARDHFATEQKHEIAARILSGKVSFDAARQQHGLQTYQLWSWVGQYAYALTRKNPKQAPDKLFPQVPETVDRMDHTQTIIPGSKLFQDPELARIIGDYVLKNRS